MKKIITILLILNFTVLFGANEFIPNNGRLLYTDGKLANDIQYTYETNNYMAYLTNNSIEPVLFIHNKLKKPSAMNKNREERDKIVEAYRLAIEFENSNETNIIPKQINDNYYNFYFSHISLDRIYSYNKLFYENIYDGIDLEVYTDEQLNLEYDFIVAPNVDIGQIKLKINEKKSILDNGDLRIETPLGYIIQDKPIAYQNDELIECSFQIDGDFITFKVSEYDKEKPLRIDPVTRAWGTYYGGILDDKIYELKVKDENMYFGGLTYSPSKIAFNGHQTIHGGNYDAFIVKSDTTGKRIWATYYGGDQYEITFGLDIDSEDNVYIVGEASSLSGIATVNAHQETFGGDWADGFIAKFDKDGSRVWATYFGGDKDDKLNDISIDDFDNIYVVGYSYSENNIAQNGHKDTLDGQSDAILAKFNPLGELTWATYYGGKDKDIFTSIEVFGSLIYLGGTTNSRNNIFFNGFDDTKDGDFDGFLTKFQTGGALEWCTYYGGTAEDYINDITVLDSNIYMVGTTYSTSNIAYPNKSKVNFGEYDGFVGVYSADCELKSADFIGGSDSDYFYTIANNEEYIYIGGTTQSNDIKTNLLAYQMHRYAQYDGLYAKYDKDLKWITSSYFGGLFTEDINVIETSSEYFYLAGSTTSEESISEDGYQMNIGGKIDGHIQKMKEAKEPKLGLEVDKVLCAGSSITVNYEYEGDLLNNANVIIELSDKEGNFNDLTVLVEANLQINDIVEFDLGQMEFSEKYRIRAYVDSLHKYFYYEEFVTIINKAKILAMPDSICTVERVDFATYKNPNCSYKWFFINGSTKLTLSTNSQFSFVFINVGTFDIILEQNYKGICISETSKELVLLPKTEINIYGDENVCYNKPYTYHFIKLNDGNLDKIVWDIGGNEIVSENGSDSVSVIWRENKGNLLKATVFNDFGCSITEEFEVNLNKLELDIFGVEKSCIECLETYYVDYEEGVFEWKVIGGEIIEGLGENKIKVKWGETEFNSIELLYTSEDSCKALKNIQIEVTDKRQVSITGQDKNCLNSTIKYITSSDTSLINNWFVDNDYGEVVDSSFNSIDIRWVKSGASKIKLIQEIPGKFKDSTEIEIEIIDLSDEELELQFENSPFCKFDKREISIINPKFESYDFNVINAKIDSTIFNGINVYFENVGDVSVEIIGYNHLITGCDYTYEKEFIVNDIPDTPFIELIGKKIISSSDENHIWYFNGVVISDLNSKEIYPSEKGLYTVRTHNEFGCYSEISNEIYYEPNSVFGDDNQIIIYPQPANERLVISNLSPNSIYKVKLFNSNGLEVLSSISNRKIRVNLNVSLLTAGLYIIELEKGGERIYKKVTILK